MTWMNYYPKKGSQHFEVRSRQPFFLFAILLSILNSVVLLSCRCDLSEKNRCNTKSDCLAGFQCISGICQQPLSDGKTIVNPDSALIDANPFDCQAGCDGIYNLKDLSPEASGPCQMKWSKLSGYRFSDGCPEYKPLTCGKCTCYKYTRTCDNHCGEDMLTWHDCTY